MTGYDRVGELPRGLDDADDGVAAGMHMDMFHCDLLLALAAMPIERFEQRGVGAGKFVRLREVLLSALECLLAEHGAAVAFHRGVVGGD